MREKLVELLDSNSLHRDGTTLLDVADHLISHGVIIPVRCRDCKFWDANHSPAGQGWCPKIVGYRSGDWFCAAGETSDI